MRQGGGEWTGFLVAAFAVVGMVGVFASYAAQVPLQQALIHGDALDQALIIYHQPNPGPALEALRPRLADGAAEVLDSKGDFPARVAKARQALRAEDAAAAQDVAFRLRLLVIVSTFAAALFGVAVLSIVRRAA